MADPSGPTALARLAAAQAYGGLPDHQLLGRFAAERDELAFAALVERHGPVVLDAAIAILRHAPDAEDVFQAAFLVLARKAAAIRKADSVGCWLHGVARRIALRSLRARVRRARHESAAPARTDPPAGDDLSWGEVRALVHKELARLPETLRAPLLLCYLQGLTQDEAAARLGLPKGTLKGRLERGREALRRRLVRRGLAPAGALLAVSLGRAANLPVPPLLVLAVARSAARFAAGSADEVPARVVELAKGASNAMTLSPLKVCLLLLAGLTAVGLGLAASAGGPPTGGPPTVAPAPPADEPPAADPDIAPPPRPAGAKEFEELTAAIRPGGVAFVLPSTIRIGGDGTCVYEVAGRPAIGTSPAWPPAKHTYTLPPENLRRLSGMLKDTDWLGKEAPKDPPALHWSEYTLTLKRDGKTVTVLCKDEQEPYKALLTYLRGVSLQEFLLYQMESVPEAAPRARQMLDGYVRAELSERYARPVDEIDYARYAAWATGIVRKPAGNPDEEVMTAIRVVGLLRLESEREYLTALAAHPNSNVREAATQALGRLKSGK